MTVAQRKNLKARKYGLIVRITLVYLGLTLLNVLFFWVTTGARQMRLISEKSLALAELTATNISSQITPLVGSEFSNINKITTFIESNIPPEKYQYLQVLDDTGKVLHKKPDDLKDVLDQTTALQLLFQSMQSREQQNKPYLIDVNSKDLSYTIVIPLQWKTEPAAALFMHNSMVDLKSEINDLFQFGLTMVIFLLFIQGVFGIYLYKTVLKPVKKLSDAAREVASENYSIQVPVPSHRDELSLLVRHFNSMAYTLGEKTSALVQNIEQLRIKDEQIQAELELGKAIQESTIPQVAPDTDLFDAHVYFSPLHKVSGDFFDFFALPEQKYGIIMADASGHGVPAALITVMAHIFLVEGFRNYDSLTEILNYVNTKLEQSVTTPDYLTAFLLIVEPNGEMSFSNAAHKPGILFRKASEKLEILDSDGFFVGSMNPSPIDYEMKKIRIEPGDKLILYTDGIAEAENASREPFGDNRVAEIVKESGRLSGERLLEELVEAVSVFQAGTPRFDDYSILILEFNGIKNS